MLKLKQKRLMVKGKALKGSDLPNQEIIIIGHVTNPEPNANCASGPALMIELSKSFFSIIKKNNLLLVYGFIIQLVESIFKYPFDMYGDLIYILPLCTRTECEQ